MEPRRDLPGSPEEGRRRLKVFADSNVLIYAIDDSDQTKRQRARHLLEQHWSQLVISTQVMLEFHAVCSRNDGIHSSAISESLKDFAALDVIPADARAVLTATSIADQIGLSTSDAMIVEAATRGGCELLVTEDAQLLAADLPLEARNPFA